MHAVVETPAYLVAAKQTRLTETERQDIVTFLATTPMAGVEIPGTGGARKLRFAGRGKGKSGGYRVVTFYAGTEVPVFLLNVFAKGDRIDLSQEDRNELREVLGAVAKAYQGGVRAYVRRRKTHP